MKMCCQYMGKSIAAAPWTHAVNYRKKKKQEDKLNASFHNNTKTKTKIPFCAQRMISL